MSNHYFITSGAQATAIAPLSTELDNGSGASAQGSTGVMQVTYKNVRIMRMVVLKYPTTASVVTFTDKNANTLLTVTVPLVATGAPSYEFGGIPCPSGGFLVTVTNNPDLCFVFDGEASV